ncbi:MAG: TRAP transporter large permease subunit, partial [Spirochaetaceae bacterium]
MNSVLLLLLVFFVLVVLKIPLAFALFLSTLVTFSSLDMSFMSLVNRMLTSVQSFPMLAIPFFLMAGLLMSDGGVTERLVKLSDALVGHLPGGLAHVNVVVSMLFAG